MAVRQSSNLFKQGALAMFSTVVALFVAVSSPANAGEDLVPEVEPSREWLGHEYADVIFKTFKAKYPDINLVISESDYTYVQSGEKWRPKLAAKNFKTAWSNSEEDNLGQWSLKEKLVSSVRSALPDMLSDVASQLEFGRELDGDLGRELEQKLGKWLEQQKENSVAPHELMVEALRLTNGHVIKAWIISWNLMRENWDIASSRGYGSKTSKMISLTGERNLWRGGVHYVVLPEESVADVKSEIRDDRDMPADFLAKQRIKAVVTKRGDEFSYLYHRIGVELFSMLAAKITGSASAGWMLGKAGAMGEYLKYTKTAGLARESKKRINNDLLAANSGVRFFQLVTGLRNPETFVENNERAYLKPNKGKFGYDYLLPDGVPPQYFNSKVDKAYLRQTMSMKELEMRFYHAVHVDSEIFSVIVLGSTGESDRLHSGLGEYEKSGAKNEVLNSYIIQWLKGYKATPYVQDIKQDVSLDYYLNQSFAQETQKNFEYKAYDDKFIVQLERIEALILKNDRDRAGKQSNPSQNQCRAIWL